MLKCTCDLAICFKGLLLNLLFLSVCILQTTIIISKQFIQDRY